MISALAPTRINLFRNPRCVAGGDLTALLARYSWTRSFLTADAGMPTGTAVRWTCPSSQTGAGRGMDFYGNPDLSSPPSGGYPVVPGQPISLMCAVRSSKSVGMAVEYRFASDTDWIGDKAAGATVTAPTSGNAWMTVAATAPQGATQVFFQVINLNPAATWATGDTIDVGAVIVESTLSAGLYFDGTSTFDKRGIPSWAGTAHASLSVLSSATSAVSVSDGTTTVGAVEIVASTLRRPLRRDTIDVLSQAAPLINAGTPGLLAGQITYLCASLARALALDALYAGTAPLTLTTSGELTGLKHQAVETPQLVAEKAVNGSPSRWLYTVEIREVP